MPRRTCIRPNAGAIYRELSKHTQLGRLANDSDIKGAVLFLASEASAYITGLSIPVDLWLCLHIKYEKVYKYKVKGVNHDA